MANNFLSRLFKKRETEPGKVLVCGHELTLKYSLYAATAYEKMTGKNALDLAQFQPDPKTGIPPLAPVVELGYCMLMADNDLDKLGITIEGLLKDLDTVESMTAFVQAVSAELIAFYQPDKSAEPAKQEDAGKNA